MLINAKKPEKIINCQGGYGHMEIVLGDVKSEEGVQFMLPNRAGGHGHVQHAEEECVAVFVHLWLYACFCLQWESIYSRKKK